jgi:hypothetical protein
MLRLGDRQLSSYRRCLLLRQIAAKYEQNSVVEPAKAEHFGEMRMPLSQENRFCGGATGISERFSEIVRDSLNSLR